ncbi:MAG: nitrogen fixation protein NifH [Candidatus Bathyarchaeum sp.]|nr:MAG: nitrogen fixation protein NifH [Candidatus Bathyarchaeum sp.]
MSDWKSLLKENPTGWLLEKNNPSVRFFTLTELLEKPDKDPEVVKAKNEIMNFGVVPKILAKQSAQGYWETPERFYTAKYKGTVWQLIILAEHGADGRDERVKKACKFILENSQDHESGGFSFCASARTGGGRHSGVIPCLTGNMVWSFIRLGYLADPRVERGVNWITTYQRFDDGIEHRPKGWPYDKATGCFGKHSCHMGVVKALKALAAIPADKRPEDVKAKIETGAEYLLIHHIHKRSHNLNRVSKPSWLRFGFPLMYQTDALEILGILTKLGYRDERMQEAVDLVISKQDDHGRWSLERTFNGRFQTNIEQKGKPSKWITLNALKVLKNFYA